MAVAFAANNLGTVATSLRKTYPDTALVICADDDGATPGNPGVTHAHEAAPECRRRRRRPQAPRR